MLATAWFPAEEWPAALAAWPALADGVGTSDHPAYCQQIQRHLLDLSVAQSAADPSLALTVVPVRLAAYGVVYRTRR